MVQLNVCLHEALETPDNWDEDQGDVQATNCWFDIEVDPQDLLDIEPNDFSSMSQFIEQCFNESTHFYRVLDNLGEDIREDIGEVFTPE